MKVVHCRHGKFDVYIGRPMPDFPDGSPFANPFKIGRDGTRAEVLAKYEQYLRNSPELMDRILELDGKKATYLPQVWEQIPTFEEFFESLSKKAGFSKSVIEDKPTIYTYTAIKIK